MNLTTLARVKRLVPLETTQHDALVSALVHAYSREVERYLDRYLLSTARTEQYDVEPFQRVWYLRGFPVASSPAAQFRFDVNRNFTGSAEDSTAYYLRTEDGRVEFDGTWNLSGRRFAGGLQVVYTGGMAAHFDRLVGAVSGGSGTPAASDTGTGATSGATGTVVSLSGSTLTLQVTNGSFEAGETINFTGSGTSSRVLDSISQTPFVMTYPDVVEALEEQVAFVFQRRENLGLSSFSSEGGSVTLEGMRGLTNQVKFALEPHRARGRSR